MVEYCWEEIVLGRALPNSMHFCGKITTASRWSKAYPSKRLLLLDITRIFGQGGSATRHSRLHSQGAGMVISPWVYAKALWLVTFPSYNRADFSSVGMIYLLCFYNHITIMSSHTLPRCLFIARNTIFALWAERSGQSEWEQTGKHLSAPTWAHCPNPSSVRCEFSQFSHP